MLYPFLLIIVSAGKRVSIQKVALQISCIILAFFMAFRKYTVGVDTKYYCYVFEQLRDCLLYTSKSQLKQCDSGNEALANILVTKDLQWDYMDIKQIMEKKENAEY